MTKVAIFEINAYFEIIGANPGEVTAQLSRARML